jgi:hypothetical protein
VFLLPNVFYMITDLIHVPPNMEWVRQIENGSAAVRHSALLCERMRFLLQCWADRRCISLNALYPQLSAQQAGGRAAPAFAFCAGLGFLWGVFFASTAGLFCPLNT